MTNQRKNELMKMEIEEINLMYERLSVERDRLHSELQRLVNIDERLSPIELMFLDWKHDEEIGVRNNAELYEVDADADATARIEDMANNVAIYEDYLVENYDDAMNSCEELERDRGNFRAVYGVATYWRVAERLSGCMACLMHFRSGGEVAC